MSVNHESHCHVHLHEVLRNFPRSFPYLIDHVMYLDSNDEQVVQRNTVQLRSKVTFERV